jgi:hypothetical protein
MFRFHVRPVYANGERSPLRLTNGREYKSVATAERAALSFAAKIEKSADDTTALRLAWLAVSVTDPAGFNVRAIAA